jgi:hypothetical protein
MKQQLFQRYACLGGWSRINNVLTHLPSRGNSGYFTIRFGVNARQRKNSY